jgi:N utilization substance protein B
MMGKRRFSRELAMQALFFMDIRNNFSKAGLALFVKCFEPSQDVLPFFLTLVNGVMRALIEIDTLIKDFSNNWKISRMTCVDRNVLRVAVYELFFCSDIPAKVSINEAIDIGKRFGTHDSGAFINGILDTIRIELEKDENLRMTLEDGKKNEIFSQTIHDNPEKHPSCPTNAVEDRKSIGQPAKKPGLDNAPAPSVRLTDKLRKRVGRLPGESNPL